MRHNISRVAVAGFSSPGFLAQRSCRGTCACTIDTRVLVQALAGSEMWVCLDMKGTGRNVAPKTIQPGREKHRLKRHHSARKGPVLEVNKYTKRKNKKKTIPWVPLPLYISGYIVNIHRHIFFQNLAIDRFTTKIFQRGTIFTNS